jgi:hypothetical protein
LVFLLTSCAACTAMKNAEWFLPVIERANLCCNPLGSLGVSLKRSIGSGHDYVVQIDFERRMYVLKISCLFVAYAGFRLRGSWSFRLSASTETLMFWTTRAAAEVHQSGRLICRRCSTVQLQWIEMVPSAYVRTLAIGSRSFRAVREY